MAAKIERQDDIILAVDNHRSAGMSHWLIMPKAGPTNSHIRDVEALTSYDLPLRMHRFVLRHHGSHLKVTSTKHGASPENARS